MPHEQRTAAALLQRLVKMFLEAEKGPVASHSDSPAMGATLGYVIDVDAAVRAFWTFWLAPLRLLDSTAVGVGAAVCVGALPHLCTGVDTLCGMSDWRLRGRPAGIEQAMSEGARAVMRVCVPAACMPPCDRFAGLICRMLRLWQ